MTPAQIRALERANAKRIRAAVASGNVVVGQPMPLESTANRRPIVFAEPTPIAFVRASATRPLAALPPAPATPPPAAPLPADPAKALAAIGDILGLPRGATTDEIRTAFEALVRTVGDASPEGITQEGRRLGLSAREIQACVRSKCPPARYVAARRAMRAR